MKTYWDDIWFIEYIKAGNNLTLEQLKTGEHQRIDLLEYLNPNLSYDVEEGDYPGGKYWDCNYGNDPKFRIILSWSVPNKCYILNFMFVDKDNKPIYDRQKGLEGKNYLDTLSNIFVTKILPYIENESLYFYAYSDDGSGSMRRKIFKKMLDKFVDNTYDVDIEGNNFIIKKNAR